MNIETVSILKLFGLSCCFALLTGLCLFSIAVQEVRQRSPRRGALEEVWTGQRLEHRLGPQAADGQRRVDEYPGFHRCYEIP